MRLIYFILIINIGCNQQFKNDCSKGKSQVYDNIQRFYVHKSDSLNIVRKAESLQPLVHFLCNNIDLGNRFLIIQITNKFHGEREGIVRIFGTEKFYYFKRSNNLFQFKKESKEFLILKKISLKFKYGLIEFKDIFNKSKSMIVYDGPTLDILYINLEEEVESGFFSVDYNPFYIL